MSLGINKNKVIGFITAFFLLLLSYLLLFINTNKLAEQAQWIDHTNKIINTLEYLASEYKSLELNFRGFMGLRTNDEKIKYQVSAKHVDSAYKLTRDLTADNKNQQLKLDTIRKQMDAKAAAIKLMMDSAGPASPDKTLKNFWRNIENITTTDSPEIIKYIKQMEFYESALLKERSNDLQKFNNSILTINLVSLVLALLLAIYSVLIYVKESAARQSADEKSEQYKIELESRVNELAVANKEINDYRSIEKFVSTGRIARTIAHEVRNPLTNINLAAEQLRESNPPTEENILLLDMVHRNGLRINHLISDLLNATRFSELTYVSTSLNNLIDEALKLASDRINLKNIHIEKHYAQDICNITIDEEKLKIAFLNIIVNALEAMEPQKGILKITTENHKEICKIIFEDNGMGMDEEIVSKLFEPFYTSKEKGNGLGLTNTQNIILNHKGKIAVESIPGKGSIFTVTLNSA